MPDRVEGNGRGFSITKNFTWLTKAFGRSLTPDSTAELPDLVAPIVRPTFDALGWTRLERYQTEQVVGVADATQIFLPQNDTEGEVKYYHHIVVRNDDSVARTISIFYFSRRQAIGSIAIMTNVTLGAGNWVAVPRNQPVFTGDSIQCDVDALTLGANIRARGMFTLLPEGEYIPFPY